MTVRLLVVPSMIAAAHMVVLALSKALTRRIRHERIDEFLTTIPRWVQRSTGTLDTLSGVLLFVAGMRTLGLRRAMGERGRLEITGIYRYVRNPLYTGVVLIYWGLGWLLNRTHLLLGAMIWLLFFQFASREEERRLLWEHGSVFRRYTKTVPAFLPDLNQLVLDIRKHGQPGGHATPHES